MLKHTLDGRPVLTIDELAERYDLAAASIRAIILREEQAERPIPVAGRCGRMALYDPRVFDRAMKARPGKGRQR